MIKSNSNYLTSAEVAIVLGYSPDHIRKLLQKGEINGQKLGRNWIVIDKEVKRVKKERLLKLKEKERILRDGYNSK